MEQTTYTNPLAVMEAKKTLSDTESYLNRFSIALAELGLPSGPSGIFSRVAIGADAELKAALAEVEEYITRTGMPEYLRDDARKRAEESVDKDIREKLTPFCQAFPEGLTEADILVEEGGSIALTGAYKEKYIREHSTMTVPADILEDLPAFEKMLDIFENLQKKYDMAGYVCTQLAWGKITNPVFALIMAQRKK